MHPAWSIFFIAVGFWGGYIVCGLLVSNRLHDLRHELIRTKQQLNTERKRTRTIDFFPADWQQQEQEQEIDKAKADTTTTAVSDEDTDLGLVLNPVPPIDWDQISQALKDKHKDKGKGKQKDENHEMIWYG